MTRAAWLAGETDPAVRRAILGAMDCIGVLESPPGSNRGPEIDEWNRRAGAPPASYWCASFVTAMWEDAGLEVLSSERASCESVRQWAKRTGRYSAKPVPGALVFYGDADHAHHIGIVTRTDLATLTVEGNTTIEGGTAGESRNGIGVSQKTITSGDNILGFALPFPVRV